MRICAYVEMLAPYGAVRYGGVPYRAAPFVALAFVAASSKYQK